MHTLTPAANSHAEFSLHGICPVNHLNCYEATEEISKFLRDLGLNQVQFKDDWKDSNELVELVKTRDCIVVGSPKSNRATEILLSRVFDAEPFNPAEANRKKIPFGFCWPQDSQDAKKSSLSCSSSAWAQLKRKAGLAWRGGQITVDFFEKRDFQIWETDKGRDAGLVFVTERPFGTQKPVKLIILAGLGGMGTVAASRALIEDYRDLQPESGDPYLWGVVEARFTKRRHESDGRTYKSFRWRYRKGGRDPIMAKTAENGRSGK